MIFSVLVHLGLLFLFQSLRSPHQIAEQVFSVEIAPPNILSQPKTVAPIEHQIVTQPEQTENSSVTDTNLLSEKDNSTTHQQIKHGDSPDAGGQVKVQKSPASQSEKQVQKKEIKSASAQKTEASQSPESNKEAREKPDAITDLKTLRLDDATLIDKFSKPKNSNPAHTSNSAGYQAFSRPMGSGAAFIGLRGTTDFLPNLPDGDITLLNTKADRFAVFVRRVASQVFGQLRASGWENLSASDIARMSDDTTVTVVMSLKGEMESIKLIDGSGSTAFDRVVLEAVRSGTRDPNPPKDAAASDGKIHFTFQSRCWVQAATNQRTGAPTERRWLLLATGLD